MSKVYFVYTYDSDGPHEVGACLSPDSIEKIIRSKWPDRADEALEMLAEKRRLYGPVAYWGQEDLEKGWGGITISVVDLYD